MLELRHGRAGDDEIIGRIRRSSLLLYTHLRDLLTLVRGEPALRQVLLSVAPTARPSQPGLWSESD